MAKGKYTLSKADKKRMLKDIKESKPIGDPKKRYSYENK